MVEQAESVGRREALKKAAQAAGAVAWSTPVVLALTPGRAAAASDTPCTASVKLIRTGGQLGNGQCGCLAANEPPYHIDSRCCGGASHFLVQASLSCTSGCEPLAIDYSQDLKIWANSDRTYWYNIYMCEGRFPILQDSHICEGSHGRPYTLRVRCAGGGDYDIEGWLSAYDCAECLQPAPGLEVDRAETEMLTESEQLADADTPTTTEVADADAADTDPAPETPTTTEVADADTADTDPAPETPTTTEAADATSATSDRAAGASTAEMSSPTTAENPSTSDAPSEDS